MQLGIIGHGADKFTPDQKRWAQQYIRDSIIGFNPDTIISGESPLGGVDIWVHEIADEMGIQFVGFIPKVKQWNPHGKYGYKKRNLDIAKESDKIIVVVRRGYNAGYEGMKHTKVVNGIEEPYCYHCDMVGHHVKSGACWTAKKAKALGKDVAWILISDNNRQMFDVMMKGEFGSE